MHDASRKLGLITEQIMDGEITRRQFVQRALALGLSAGATGALLAACSSGGSSSTTHSTAHTTSAARPVSGHLRVLVGFGTGNSPAQIPIEVALASAFSKLHRDVTIEFIRVTSSVEAKTMLLSGDAAPDLVVPMGIYSTSLFVDQEVFLDLTALLQRDGRHLEDFLPVTAQAVRVPNYYGVDSNAAIGIPIAVHDHALAYNASLFKKSGVDPPPSDWSDTSWTFEGFARVAAELTADAKGRHPGDSGFDAAGVKQFGVGHFFRETIFFAYGGGYYDAAARKATLATSASVDGIQFAADLVNKLKVQPSLAQMSTLGTGGGRENQEQFLWRSGQLAMIDMCSCDIKTPFGTDLPFDFATAAIPAGPARRFTFLNLDVGAIPKASKNQDASWELLKFLAFDPTNETKVAFDAFGSFPPLKVNNDAFVRGIKATLPKTDPAVWQNGFPSAGPDNEAWFPGFAEVHALVADGFDSIVGGTPAAVAMPKLQSDAQAHVDRWFATHKLPKG